MMVNIQIDKRKVKQILKLYSESVSKCEISLLLGISSNTITKYIGFFKRYQLTNYEVSKDLGKTAQTIQIGPKAQVGILY